MALPNFNETARLTSASVEKAPFAPPSIPPCPGSIMIVLKTLFGVWQKLNEKNNDTGRKIKPSEIVLIIWKGLMVEIFFKVNLTTLFFFDFDHIQKSFCTC